MIEDSIIIKGNKEGLNAVINMNKFKDFNEMLESLTEKLQKGKKFYKGSTLKITAELKYINERELRKLKDVLFDEFFIKDCIFEEIKETAPKVFSGIYEGRTRFIRKTIRGGQIIHYPGNIVIIGDVNYGAEIYAAGNIIVLGALRGHVHAGFNGNAKAIVAAFYLQPKILQIANIVTRSPEDNVKPQYPEVARVKGNSIIVEPYLPNKFI
ncbi:putative septum site-determining protein MinC [Clostridium acetireducens DSM 10703]|jgi:septum site-determining protein MinC|uniref:Probable septum site-determining protein MinC n=1 Tax=Clostridium acetireducens DSM 10703 TaxID=1121290 RepID=A0A1E8F1A2_9CLOT|nr:septum site-determining protein MinC [Clostridium acetireducens]OFI07226.1 putative septum site-determining protein MinC [Clostridium acetireducens DSM 10703]